MESERIPSALRPFFSGHCYQTMILDMDWFDVDCLKSLSSRIIGYAIILVTSLFLKLPQIYKILKAGNAEGIPFWSPFLIVVTGVFGSSYSWTKGFPISTWGEMVVLNIQTLIISLLVLVYGGRGRQAALVLVAYVIGVLFVMSPLMPMSLHIVMQILSTPMSAYSKILQIRSNWRNGGIGQLSGATVLMQLLRTSGRLYSNWVETGDPYRMTLYGTASLLSLVVLAQVVYYTGRRRGPRQKPPKST